MKKLLCLFSIIFSLLIVCVASYDVKAAETTWYELAAENAGNPVLLEEEQYFQGVSMTSHLISDLTFLEIPFEKYVNGDEKQIQIITFTEALFMRNNEIINEVVMYLYTPYNDEIDTVKTRIEVISQEILQNEEMIDCTPNAVLYHHQWLKVSSYGNIYKFSYSEPTDHKASAKELLLKDYNKKINHTIVSTIFKARINEIIYTNGATDKYSSLFNLGDCVASQEFNFIYEKNVEYPEAVALLSDDVETTKRHYTSSVGYNETTAKVSGKMSRFRYDTKELYKFNSILGDSNTFSMDAAYTDFFYFFFNVTDAASGKPWTGKEILTRVDYTYIEYLTEITNKWSSIFPGLASGSNNVTAEVTYFNKFGGVYAEDVFSPENDYYINDFDDIPYRESSELENIYIQDTIYPGVIENKYPKDSFYNNVVDWIDLLEYQLTIAKMPTLFSTSDEEFIEYADAKLNESIEISDYQFGLMVGGKGYPATHKEDIRYYIIYGESDITVTQYTTELVTVDEIYYEYLGEACHATVLETTVDTSDINVPINGGSSQNPIFPEEPDPETNPKSWWDEFVEWLKEAWAWIQENYQVLIFVAVSVVVVIVVIKIIRRVQTWRAQKAIIDMSKKKKE